MIIQVYSITTVEDGHIRATVHRTEAEYLASLKSLIQLRRWKMDEIRDQDSKDALREVLFHLKEGAISLAWEKFTSEQLHPAWFQFSTDVHSLDIPLETF
jgi:hypothetical protein